MADFSSIGKWIPQTSGERLFLALYEYVVSHLSPQLVNQPWVVSSEGLTEFFRLTTVMEITHRCLNEGVDLLSVFPDASTEALLRRLRMKVGFAFNIEFERRVAEQTWHASHAYIHANLTKTMADQAHRESTKYCCWCGTLTSRSKVQDYDTATVEHIWPQFLGGTSIIDNLTVACYNCNNRRQHAYNWGWFPIHTFSDKFSAKNGLPKEIKLAVGIHRLMKIASAQTIHSSERLSLKDALQIVSPVIPSIPCELDTRYTFFEILNLALE
jgi:hypothetical protein